nr:furin-like protease 2 [Onthophagus taurus]
MVLVKILGLVVCAFAAFNENGVEATYQRSNPVYTNEFAVHIPEGNDVADEIASKHGFVNRGQVGSLRGFYLFEHSRVHKRSADLNDFYYQSLDDEPRVHWVQQQHEKKRRKRDYSHLDNPPPFLQYFGALTGAGKRGHASYRASGLSEFSDPLFKEQWYLNGGAKDGLDMNVEPAWKKGYTGKGIVVSILDDGIQTNHPDLVQNYDPLASTDINGNDNDPMPQDNGDNKHGTRCAGEVAAVAFNQYCGIGIAYNASIGGVRMLDGIVNDAVEAKALGLNPEHIDIYSASWGPEDDGKTVDGPGPLARRAFIYGVTSGRKGKGSIFVWASGNGGRHTDSCNCDGYTNSIFTLSISSATQGGYKPWYLEECSSTLATTYSSGTPGHDKSIATVDMDARLRPDHICTVEHTGTSASAPLAAGICALALEANPNLTWRDMQYLVVLTSRSAPLEKEAGWITNGVKRKVSHKFGYGLMDAAAMVNLAEMWISVPPQHICKSQELLEDRQIDSSSKYTLTLHMDVSACKGTLNEVVFLEHVQCKISLRFFPRGNLKIMLTSPMGTTSTLLFERPRDVVSSNFDDWPFLSVHFWGETAVGRWTLQIVNSGNRQVDRPGILKKWQLIFYGTQVNPIRLKQPNSVPYKSIKNLDVPSLSPFFVRDQQTQQPIVTDNLYNSDVYRGFNNFQNVYSFSGSDPEESITSLDGKKTIVRNNNNVIEFEEDEHKDNCHEQCDGQGCFGKGAEKCIACRNNRMDKTCVSVCPPRSYSDRDRVCQPCHESCFTCSGPTQQHCQTCSPGYVHVIDLNVCLQQCPEGYYEDVRNKRCIPCQPNCRSCQERPDDCLSCERHLVLYQNKCLASCPPKTFETEDYTCAPCHRTCETCTGSNSSQCVNCGHDRFWLKGSCEEKCPDKHYSDPVQRECVECPNGCTECNRTNCLVCLKGWELNGKGRCVPNEIESQKCDPDEYKDGTFCKPCHSTCETCDGPTEDACLSCVDPLLLEGTHCVSQCNKGFYRDTPTSKNCIPCVHTCSECWSKNNCTECTKGLLLQNGRCLVACADGYYSDRDVCTRCHLSCETCSGPGSDQCVTCPAGWEFAAGACLPDCPDGFYKTDYGCQKCHVTCKDCFGCNVQMASRKSDDAVSVEAYLVSSEPVSSTLQVIHPFVFIIGTTIFICLCIVLIVVMLVLQRGNDNVPSNEYSRISIKKPKVTCNYNILPASDADESSDTDSGEVERRKTKPPNNKSDC